MVNKSDIPAILEKLAAGQSQTSIAQEYGTSQGAISYYRKKAALSGNGLNPAGSSVVIGLRAFINKAWQAREDAISGMAQLGAKSAIEWELAIDAAEGAASAWRKVAAELSNRRPS